jgi:Outer membrane protein beta-barrel family/Carboxypeptidase regulatory-like domain
MYLCNITSHFIIMYKIFFTLCLLCSIATFTNAQSTIIVTGTVKTDDGKGLSKAIVSIYYIGQKDTLTNITSDNGTYTFKNVQPKKAMLRISHVGFKKFLDAFDFTGAKGEVVNNDLLLSPGDNMLETVTVESSKISIKEDTISYKIDSTMYRKNDNVEEVLKKLPGVEVDKDGKVTAQGKEVTKVKVNGKEFFGGDVKTATRQLNADMVDRIQIVDDYGDQAAFTGVKDGDPTKTLNIQLRKDKNKGVFGSANVGGGTEKRYLGSFNLNLFNNARQISFNSNLNNTNASNFDFSRIPGSVMRSFGGLMGAGGFGGAGNNDGINETKTFGLNYRDEWSPRASVNGSYSFSSRKNFLENDLYEQRPSSKADSTVFNKQTATNNSITDNHRFSFNIEYKIDSFNYVKFTPNITFRKLNENYIAVSNLANNKAETLTNAVNTSVNISQTPNFSGTLLYNHRFHKKGRTLSMNFTGSNSSTEGDDNVSNSIDRYVNNTYLSSNILLQNTLQDNKNYNYGVTASFNEQLTKKKGLEFNYAYNSRYIENDRETFDINGNIRTLSPFQTNIYNNTYITNRFGANYRITQRKYNYSVGLAVQPATIISNTITGSKLVFKQNIVNYFPVVRLAYNFSKSRSLNINYNGSTNQPTFQQSQPTPDYSNLQNITIGNPDLRPEFSNTFSLRYNNFDFISGNVFFGNLSATFVKDKIVNNVTRKNFGTQENSYLNENGYFNVNAFYTVSKPIKNRKYVFNYGGLINFNNNISYLNSQKNTGRNWVVTQRFSMDYKLNKWLETTGGATLSLNKSNNSLNESINNNIQSWTISHSSRMFFKHDINFNYDVEKILNSGFTNNVGANPLVFNATLEKQIFKNKNGAIKLQGFDLLNENTNVSRNVNALNATITDSRTNRIQRYFMLSFVYRFNKFKGATGSGPGFQGGQGGGGMRMGGPGF